MRAAVALTLALAVLAPAPIGGQARRTATVRGTPAQPGSLLEITLHGIDGDREPAGTALGHPLVFVPAGAVTWRTLVGIDVARPPGPGAFRIDVLTGAGRELAVAGTIPVASRTFATRTLQVATQFVDPSPAELDRIRQEASRLEAIFGTVTVPEALDVFDRPVPGAAGSNFGTRSIFNGEERAPHAGVDFRGKTGTPVAAPGDGRIVLAENLFFTGQTVIIDHGLGLYSLLAHLSRIDVAAGTPIGRGDTVGLLGATGRVTGPHLHWAVRLEGARVDPMRLLALLAPAQSGAPSKARRPPPAK